MSELITVNKAKLKETIKDLLLKSIDDVSFLDIDVFEQHDEYKKAESVYIEEEYERILSGILSATAEDK